MRSASLGKFTPEIRKRMGGAQEGGKARHCLDPCLGWEVPQKRGPQQQVAAGKLDTAQPAGLQGLLVPSVGQPR